MGWEDEWYLWMNDRVLWEFWCCENSVAWKIQVLWQSWCCEDSSHSRNGVFWNARVLWKFGCLKCSGVLKYRMHWNFDALEIPMLRKVWWFVGLHAFKFQLFGRWVPENSCVWSATSFWQMRVVQASTQIYNQHPWGQTCMTRLQEEESELWSGKAWVLSKVVGKYISPSKLVMITVQDEEIDSSWRQELKSSQYLLSNKLKRHPSADKRDEILFQAELSLKILTVLYYDHTENNQCENILRWQYRK